MSTTPAAPQRFRISGAGRVLITVYAILAIGATSRAVYQLLTAYSSAPVPITLSAISGVIYLVATTALLLRGAAWYRVAWITISTELVGVLLVGTLSLVAPAIFADDSSVWSYYGIGYLFIPLVLPVLGMIYLRRRHAAVETGGAAHPDSANAG